MAETKWTPGPWHWVYDGTAWKPMAKLVVVGAKPPYDPDLVIADDGSSGGEYAVTIDYRSPDAYLIAAAPELYEVLQEISDTLESAQAANRVEIDPGFRKRMRDALAKARGEQPEARGET
jgi:hypothetical protein